MATAVLLANCATTREARKEEALVCPQCRTVEVKIVSTEPGGRYPGFPQSRWGSGGGIYTGTAYEHRCEGKFQHNVRFAKRLLSRVQ
jgi:hypothetical protein